MTRICLKVFNIILELWKALLVTRLQVQGGGNLTQHLLGANHLQTNAETVPSFLILTRRTAAITVSWFTSRINVLTLSKSLSWCKSTLTWSMVSGTQLGCRTNWIQPPLPVYHAVSNSFRSKFGVHLTMFMKFNTVRPIIRLISFIPKIQRAFIESNVDHIQYFFSCYSPNNTETLWY